MSAEPRHDRVEIMQRFGLGRGRATQDHDFDSKRARRFDLGVGRAAAAVLGHHRLHPLVTHERGFVIKREGPALKDERAVGQGADLLGSIDRPHDIAMLRGSRESGDLQPALREKNCSWGCPESVDGLLDRRDLDPAIVGAACPGGTGEDDERGTGRPAGCDGVGGHTPSERMGRVDNGVDALAHKKRSQALNAAEAADALGNWRPRRMRRGPCQRQDWRNIRLASKLPRKRARLRGAAEDKQAKAIQRAAP